MVLRLDGHLNVVADNTRAAPARRHRAAEQLRAAGLLEDTTGNDHSKGPRD